MNLHRSFLFVPAVRENMLQKASASEADVVVLDLEDSVPPAEKEQARQLARTYAPQIAAAGRQVHIRLNSISSGLTREDVAATLGEGVSGVSLPKTDQPQEVRDLDVILREFELDRDIRPGSTDLIIWIESASGLLRARESLAASTRVSGIALGPEDYTSDLGIDRTAAGGELNYARNVISIAARAAGVLGFDGPYSDFRDDEGLRAECAHIKQIGLKGKFCVHPAQIPAVNEAFTPAAEEVEYARRVIEAFDEGIGEGRAAVQLDGKMIDTPVAARARKLLAAAAAIAERAGS